MSHVGLGFVGGATAGFNVQSGVVVWGVEGTWSFANIKGQGSGFNSFPVGPGANIDVHVTDTTRIKNLATLAARLGLVSGPGDRTLWYVKGGGAWMRQNLHETTYQSINVFGTSTTANILTECDGPCPVGSTTFIAADYAAQRNRWGWMAGTGIEFGLFDNWSTKVEYNYMNFGKKTVTLNGSTCFIVGEIFCTPVGALNYTRTLDTQVHTVTIGLNYRFTTWAPY